MRTGAVVLHQQDELCIVDAGGTAVGMFLAPLQSAWLPDVERALCDAAARHGGPLPSLGLFRLDPRFPLRPGFDTNIADLARTQRALAGAVRANALVLEFGGIVGATMRAAMSAVNRVVDVRPPTSVHRTVFEAMQRLEAYLPEGVDQAAWRRDVVGAVQFVREILDVEGP